MNEKVVRNGACKLLQAWSRIVRHCVVVHITYQCVQQLWVQLVEILQLLWKLVVLEFDQMLLFKKEINK